MTTAGTAVRSGARAARGWQVRRANRRALARFGDFWAALQRVGDALADAEKWKNLSRQHETRAKANADKAIRFDQIEAAHAEALAFAHERGVVHQECVRPLGRHGAVRGDAACDQGVRAALVGGPADRTEGIGASDAMSGTFSARSHRTG